MCGRMSFAQPKPFNKAYKTNLSPRYNIAPGQALTGVRPGGALVQGQWGIRSPQGPLWVNARSETWTEKAAFQKSSLIWIAAGGWYEWNAQKIPHHFSYTPSWFWLAALETQGQIVVLTQKATPKIAAIHDRMPIAIDTQQTLPKTLEGIENLAEKDLQFYSVSAQVNKSSWEDPNCIEPYSYPEQTSLL